MLRPVIALMTSSALRIELSHWNFSLGSFSDHAGSLLSDDPPTIAMKLLPEFSNGYVLQDLQTFLGRPHFRIPSSTRFGDSDNTFVNHHSRCDAYRDRSLRLVGTH